jgi:hypothetical protein
MNTRTRWDVIEEEKMGCKRRNTTITNKKGYTTIPRFPVFNIVFSLLHEALSSMRVLRTVFKRGCGNGERFADLDKRIDSLL